MSKRLARRVLTGTAAALAALLGTTAAMAATTWTVRPGGAVTANFGSVTVRDANTGFVVTCPSTLKATLKSGTGLPGAGIGSVSSFTFGTCTGPLGFTYTLKLSHLPATLNATSYESSTGTTTAEITGMHGTFVGTSCSYVLDGTGASQDNGTIAVTYVNGTGKLQLLASGNLHVYELQGGCFGLVNSGDHLTLSATGTATPAQTITSP